LSDQTQIRVDKWLWYARQAKSRTVAQKIIAEGHIRINREKIRSASRKITVGDVLTLNLAIGIRVLKVVECGKRRGPYEEAKTLYEDLSPVIEVKPEADLASRGLPAPAGRPDRRGRMLARQMSGKE